MVALKATQSLASKASIENITGCWAMNKRLSTDVDTMFKMQNVNWLIRKTLQTATIYLTFTQHTTADPSSSLPIIHLDIIQTTSVKIAPIKETRVLDGQPRTHKDHIFGSLVTQSRSVRGRPDSHGVVRPDVQGTDLGIEDEDEDEDGDGRVGRFLRGEIDCSGNECAGFLVEEPVGSGFGKGSGLWTHTVEREVNSAWVAETVWGFEVMDEERYLTSRVVVVDRRGEYRFVRCVFELVG